MRKGRPEAASLFSTCYWQQLPPSQQAGSPQQTPIVAAEADNDEKITAANTNDRNLIFIKISFGFLAIERHGYKNKAAVKREPG
jgi:hypothetical protein